MLFEIRRVVAVSGCSSSSAESNDVSVPFSNRFEDRNIKIPTCIRFIEHFRISNTLFRNETISENDPEIIFTNVRCTKRAVERYRFDM